MSTIKVKASQLQPLAGYVLLEPSEPETKTASGIILPEKSDDKPQHGVILAVGASIWENGKEITCPVKKGAKVLYKKWGGNEFKMDDKEYQLLKFEDLIAIIK